MNKKLLATYVFLIAAFTAMHVAGQMSRQQTTASMHGDLLAAAQGGGGGNQGNSGGAGGNQGNAQGGGHAYGRNKDRGGGSTENNGQGGNDGGGATIHGRGLRQHAAALDHVLKRYGIHNNPIRTYEFRHINVRPAAFASRDAEAAWGDNLHNVTCSMFRYLQQLKEARPRLRIDYVEWIVEQVARTLDEDPVEVKAALLGFPHRHDHTSTLLKNISEIGCARGDTASISELEDFAEEHAEHAEHERSTELSSRFTVTDQSTGTDIAFQVVESGAVFTDYGISHEKEMHLLVVRDDLRHFAHVHPERDAEGTWRLPFTPPAGGTYWFFADFADSEITHHTVRFDRTYDGERGTYGFVRGMQRRKNVGEFMVILEQTSYSDGILFTFHINDDQGRAPFLEPYLGAMGHGILLSQAGDFIHTHPSPVSDHLTLHLPNTLTGIYRIFTQFQVEGKVHTAEFDWIPGIDGRNKSVPEHLH